MAGIDSGDNVQYRCAEGAVIHVYLSPGHAGRSTATLTSWGIDDVEAVVDELTSRHVAFERYDEGPIVTDERGIAAFEGGAKVAYFRVLDSNTSRAPKRRIPKRVQTPSRDCGTAYSYEVLEKLSEK